MDKKAVIKELAVRQLEKRHKQESDNYIDFVRYWFKEGKKFDFEADDFHYLIAKYLEKCYRGEITRLIINIPPRHGKTEMITKCFPAWVLGKKPDTKIIVTGYSSTLTQQFSLEAKDIVTSDVYKNVFPRHHGIREEQNTKEYWVLKDGGSYYATGTGGSITGKGAGIFLIDDPIKPDEAESEIIRTGINNWFENTVPSRLDNPNKGCIIIIMQRTHEDDLCGHLIEKMKNHSGDDWTVLSMPAIAEHDEFIQVDDFVYKRLKGEVLHPKRFNQDGIEKIRKNMNNSTFECQYQQNPISKESQEFHSEWFKYIDRDQVPTGGRVFTTVDPAWTKQSYSDETAIVTGKFIDDKLYILGYTAGKFDPAEAIDAIVEHIKIYKPEKIGVEAIQAKGVLSIPLKNTCQSMGIYANIEEIAQRGDKQSRIRKMIPLFRDGLVYFVRGIEEGQTSLEKQLLSFPRGKHDDVCFSGDTMIKIKGGDKKIKDVKVGDYAMTRKGYKKVVASGCTGEKNTINKIGLEATPEHPIITKNGVVRIDSLKESDTLYIWNKQSSSIEEKSIEEILTQNSGNTECTFGSMTNGKSLLLHYIDKFGLIISDLFLKTIIYTMKMVIHLIMILAIGNVYTEKSMQNYTQIALRERRWHQKMLLKIMQGCRKLQKYGEAQKNERNGIQNIQKTVSGSVTLRSGEIATQSKRCVKNAEQNSKHGKNLGYTAHQNAHVECLIEHEERGIKKVYNIQVEGEHEYFANGILVHNCDALQMVYDLYTLQPNVQTRHRGIKVTYHNGKPVLSK